MYSSLTGFKYCHHLQHLRFVCQGHLRGVQGHQTRIRAPVRPQGPFQQLQVRRLQGQGLLDGHLNTVDGHIYLYIVFAKGGECVIGTLG
jgi:hypothetical protein